MSKRSDSCSIPLVLLGLVTAARCSILPAVAGCVEPKTSPQPNWIFIIDLATDVKSPYHLLSVPGNRMRSDHTPLFDWLETAAATDIKSEIPAHSKQSDLRWISAKGDTVVLYVVYNTTTHDEPSVVSDEKARKSRLQTDLETLLKLIKLIRKTEGAALTEGSELAVSRSTYTLVQKRADLKITAKATAKKDAAGAQDVSVETTLVTGPVEHLFLSADLPLTRTRELKYDSTSATLEPRDKPTTFLVGFDFMIGDLLSENRPRWWHGITLKLLLEGSSHPTDSGGLALGYRVRTLKWHGVELDAFSPFVGVVRRENDSLRADGTPITGANADYKWVAGISFNLDRALGWISEKVADSKKPNPEN